MNRLGSITNSFRLLSLISTGQHSRKFGTSNVNHRAYKLVVTRRVSQVPAKKTNYWIRKILADGGRVKYPMYKYGEANIFKRSNRGLYGGLFPGIKYRTTKIIKRKIKRHVLPNIVKKRIYSRTLNRALKLRVATKVLRTIKKEGGLDNYLTKDKPARIKQLGPLGWRLRYAVLLRQQNMRPSNISSQTAVV
ncbi:mitochondrial 54S ribosomal protein bL28m [Lipomyces oligophaga]|uniref:mitochondrial 54S ribosomal protein bL28m n=1 Tax=Lipomyces oligophaga TaxID=45792 RepID=UPI0034CF9768